MYQAAIQKQIVCLHHQQRPLFQSSTWGFEARQASSKYTFEFWASFRLLHIAQISSCPRSLQASSTAASRKQGLHISYAPTKKLAQTQIATQRTKVKAPFLRAFGAFSAGFQFRCQFDWLWACSQSARLDQQIDWLLLCVLLWLSLLLSLLSLRLNICMSFYTGLSRLLLAFPWSIPQQLTGSHTFGQPIESQVSPKRKRLVVGRLAKAWSKARLASRATLRFESASRCKLGPFNVYLYSGVGSKLVPLALAFLSARFTRLGVSSGRSKPQFSSCKLLFGATSRLWRIASILFNLCSRALPIESSLSIFIHPSSIDRKSRPLDLFDHANDSKSKPEVKPSARNILWDNSSKIIDITSQLVSRKPQRRLDSTVAFN